MKKLFFLLFFSVFSSFALKIDRVIISTDTNPMYMDFWPAVAKAWEKIVGIKPTLAFIAPKDFPIDESLGDVIRFDPIEGVSTALQAQFIRLLLPLYFKDEVCLISDIDMIPLNKSYFLDTVRDIPDDNFVVYRSDVLLQYNQYPMCYIAAKGSVFCEVFGVETPEDIEDFIKQEAERLNHAWSTDQQSLYFHVNKWEGCQSRCEKLGLGVERRVDRVNWKYDVALLKKGYYIDSHMLRPYSRYKNEVDKLLRDLGIFEHE